MYVEIPEQTIQMSFYRFPKESKKRAAQVFETPEEDIVMFALNMFAVSLKLVLLSPNKY